LPNTGFADDYGVPLMIGLTALFIGIILLSRKLRSSSSA
jgi:LPXTG-motif cell wall-anchored protein